MQDNAYAPPSAAIGQTPEPASEFEAIRRSCIKREASIKGIGSLSLLGACLYGVVLAVMVSKAPIGTPFWIAIGMMGGVCVACAAIGIGLRRLRPWARILFTGMAVLNVLMQVFGIGNLARATAQVDGKTTELPIVSWLIMGAFLWVLWSRPSDTIFSLRYRHEIVPATPHVKYRTAMWLWILLGVLALLVVVAIVAARR